MANKNQTPKYIRHCLDLYDEIKALGLSDGQTTVDIIPLGNKEDSMKINIYPKTYNEQMIQWQR